MLRRINLGDPGWYNYQENHVGNDSNLKRRERLFKKVIKQSSRVPDFLLASLLLSSRNDTRNSQVENVIPRESEHPNFHQEERAPEGHSWVFDSFFFKFYFIFKLYITVLVLPNIKMNPPQVYMCSPSWIKPSAKKDQVKRPAMCSIAQGRRLFWRQSIWHCG